MVAMEAPLLIQAHCTQGGTDGAFAGSEDRARQEDLGVLPDSFGEKWREGGQDLYDFLG
jgi:hypothetical protein